MPTKLRKGQNVPYGQADELGLFRNQGVSMESFIPLGDSRRDPSKVKFLRDEKTGKEVKSPVEGQAFDATSENVAEMLMASRPDRYERYFEKALDSVMALFEYNTSDYDNVLYRFFTEEGNGTTSYPAWGNRSTADSVVYAAHILALKMMKQYESVVLAGQYRNW
jgi:hypothetical protein